MTNRISLVTSALLFTSAVYAASVPVVITSPRGGEIFVIGQTQFVRLADTTRFKSVRIELSRDGGANYAVLGVIDNTVSKPNRNFLQFQVNGPVSDNCVIRATGISPTKPGEGVTGAFVITDTVAPTPSGLAGGDLTGTYPNPAIAANAVTTGKIANGSVTKAKVNSGSASTNFVLAADGSNGADWVTPLSIIPSNFGSTSIQTTGTVTAADFIGSGAGLTSIPSSALPTVGAPYVLKAGDTMTGLLTLSGDPNANLHAATKQYVDAETTRAQGAETTLTTSLNAEVTRATAAEGTKLAKAGDIMTGLLTLSGAPTTNLHAATKQYVDAETTRAQGAETTLTTSLNAEVTRATAAEGTKVAKAGDIMTGLLTLNNGVAVINLGGSTTFAAEGRPLNTGAGNTFAGVGAGSANASGASNAFYGRNAGRSNISGVNDTFVGESAGDANIDGGSNTFIGTSAGFKNTSGNFNTFLGRSSGYNNGMGSSNTFIGENAGSANGIGISNTFVGQGAGLSNTAAGSNVFVGQGAGNTTSGAASGNNTFVGTVAGYGNISGFTNTFIGYGAGLNNTSGSNNIAIGNTAGTLLTTGSNNIAIGHSGVAGESFAIRIGTPAGITSCFIAGISGITVSGGTAVSILPSGQLGTITSSRRFKDNIKEMGASSDALLQLRPVTFTYKRELDAKGIPQWGLIAEEVEAINPDWVVHDERGEINTVRYEQINAMLLNEFLKEHRKVEAQQKAIAEQQKQIHDLDQRVSELHKLIRK